ncbi:MAG TPA: hypothetical protein VHF89_08415 [Solirubrobacteraceae bacterium]|nr:hypothetical protein [Solirubrobacteraceae bacterium]
MLLAAVAVAAVPVTAEAGSARDRATGGGQVLLDPNSPPTTGALDTVAFTAQQEHGATDGAADGQVQVNRRSGGADALKFHGVVDCLIVSGTKAYISGHERGTNVPFELFAIDGGSGAAERGTDQTIVWYGDETEENEPDQQAPGNFTPPTEDEFCGIEEDPNSKREAALARGNNQVYDAP